MAGSSSRRHVDLVECLGAFGTGLDARRVLDGLGEQTGEVGVRQRDTGLREVGTHGVGVDDSVGGLGQVVGLQDGRNVAVHDDAADRKPECPQVLDGLGGLLDRQRFQQRYEVNRGQLGVQQFDHTLAL